MTNRVAIVLIFKLIILNVCILFDRNFNLIISIRNQSHQPSHLNSDTSYLQRTNSYSTTLLVITKVTFPQESTSFPASDTAQRRKTNVRSLCGSRGAPANPGTEFESLGRSGPRTELLCYCTVGFGLVTVMLDLKIIDTEKFRLELHIGIL